MEDHETFPSVVSMAEWILKYLRKNAGSEKIAQIFANDGSAITYEELLQQSVCVAAGLRDMGFKSGDLVSIIAHSSHEIYPVIIGCIFLDVLIHVSEVELNADQLSRNLARIKPRRIVSTKNKVPDVQKATANFTPQPIVYQFEQLFKVALRLGSKAHVDNFQPTEIADPFNHSFACLFSSGTSTFQKAVLFNDFAYIHSVFKGSQIPEVFEGPYMITCQPWWTAWWINLLRLFKHCRTRIFVDKCTPEIIADAIHKYEPDVWYAVPQILRDVQKLIQQNPGIWDTSSLKLVVAVGDRCDLATTINLMETFRVNLIQEYVSSEVGVPAATPLDRPIKLGSIGIPTRQYKLIDLYTGELITEANRPGELLIEYIDMNGYLYYPDSLDPYLDEDRYFKTGDVFYRNEEGFLFFVHRLLTMFKSYGIWVGPGDIEPIIMEIPGVSEVVVVGRPMEDEEVGQAAAAFIVRAPDSYLTEQDVYDFFEKEKVHYSRKLGGGVFFVNAIPKNPNGKFLRRELRIRLLKLSEDSALTE